MSEVPGYVPEEAKGEGGSYLERQQEELNKMKEDLGPAEEPVSHGQNVSVGTVEDMHDRLVESQQWRRANPETDAERRNVASQDVVQSGYEQQVQSEALDQFGQTLRAEEDRRKQGGVGETGAEQDRSAA